jgi:hypothetical protein
MLFAKCDAAFPANIEASIREDAVAELYLAVIEGEVAESDIKAKAGRYLNATYAAWANRFGPASLDAVLSADDDRTRGEFIEDETTLAMLDEFEIGESPP